MNQRVLITNHCTILFKKYVYNTPRMSTVHIPLRDTIPLRKLKEFVCASRTLGIPTAWSLLWVVTRKHHLLNRLCVCINVKPNHKLCFLYFSHSPGYRGRPWKCISFPSRSSGHRKRELMDVFFPQSDNGCLCSYNHMRFTVFSGFWMLPWY